MDWYKIAGGGASSDAAYAVNGVVGEPEAQPAMGDSTYSLTGGDSLTVYVVPAVNVNSPVICAGDPALLTATTDASNPLFQWNSPAATSASIMVSPTATTNYLVTVTDGVTEWQNTAAAVVTVNFAAATNVTYLEAKGLPFKLDAADLMTHAAGTGGALLLNVPTQSANGVGLAWVAGMIFYNGNLTVADSFNYTVQSLTGDCIAVGTVSLAPLAGAGPSLTLTPTNHTVIVKIFGIPHFTYVMQTTTNLSVPWWPLCTNTAGSDGSWIFTDANATNAQQYYRVVQP